MIIEEARDILQDQIDRYGEEYDTEVIEALEVAIKALEQTDVLDKIKVEIDLKQYDFMDNKDYDEGIRFGLMLAYQIIDKYKSESEDKE